MEGSFPIGEPTWVSDGHLHLAPEWFPLTGQPDLSPLWCSSEPPREGVDPREDPKRPSTNPGADLATGHSGRAGRSHNLRPVALATVEAEE